MNKLGTRVLVGLLVAVLAAGLPAATAAGAGSNPPGVESVFSATNDYRIANGASSLTFDGRLQLVAQAWAERMAADFAADPNPDRNEARNDAFRHNTSMTSQIPAGWRSAGENIAFNGGYPDPYAKLMDQWKTSPPHNANLLSPTWTAIGVGVYTDASGITWGVQVFAKYDYTWTPVDITLTGPSSVVWGTTASYSVTVDPAVTRTAALQYSRPGGAWLTSAATVSVVNGVGSFTLTPVDPMVTYRVVIDGSISNSIPVAATSATVTLTGPSSVVWGTTASYGVAVSTPVTGTAALQYSRPGGAWLTSAATVSVVNGVGTFTLTPVDPMVTYRVAIAGSTSNAIPVAATPATS